MRWASCRVFHSLRLCDVDQMTAQTRSTVVGPIRFSIQAFSFAGRAPCAYLCRASGRRPTPSARPCPRPARRRSAPPRRPRRAGRTPRRTRTYTRSRRRAAPRRAACGHESGPGERYTATLQQTIQYNTNKFITVFDLISGQSA